MLFFFNTFPTCLFLCIICVANDVQDILIALIKHTIIFKICISFIIRNQNHILFFLVICGMDCLRDLKYHKLHDFLLY